jgi:hypothetical protein
MSLDYQEYQELRKKSRLLGILWRIGDFGYYIALFAAIGSPLGMTFVKFTSRSDRLPWDKVLLTSFLSMVFWACVLWGAAELKCFALKRGKTLKNKP